MFLVVVFPHKMSINGRTKSLIPSLLEKERKGDDITIFTEWSKSKGAPPLQ